MSTNIIVIIGVVITLLIAFMSMDDSAVLEKRLKRVGSGTPPVEKKKKKEKHEDQLSAVRSTKQSSGIFKILPNKEKLQAEIARTGKEITFTTYGVWMFFSAILGFVLAKFIFKVSLPLVIIFSIFMALWFPYKIVVRMGNKRTKEFIANFPEAIDTMVRGLRSGLPVGESINAVGREAPDPVGEEFRFIADATRLGRTLEDAMWDVSKRITLPEFRFLIISMAIQRETGGNLAETLGNLSELLRKRRQLKLKIRAMSSEARASAMIIGSLPFVMFTLLLLVNKSYALLLFTDERGQTMLMGGGTWMFIGIMVMKKMIEFEF